MLRKIKVCQSFLQISAILTAICLVGCLEDSTSANTTHPNNTAYPTNDINLSSTTLTLVNESSSIAAGQVFYTNFTVNSAASINVNVQVTNGDGVQVYLLDDYNQLINLLNNNYFIYNKALSASYKITSFNKSAMLTAGTWYIAIVNPNLLLSQTVSRIITAYY